MDDRIYVSWEKIGRFIIEALERVGVPHEDALICAEVLMERKNKGVPLGEAVRVELMQIREELGMDFVFPFEMK